MARRALVSNAKSGDLALFDVAAAPRDQAASEATVTSAAGANMLGLAGSAPVGIRIDPGRCEAYVAYTAADAIGVYDLASGTLVTTLVAGREPDGHGALPAERPALASPGRRAPAFFTAVLVFVVAFAVGAPPPSSSPPWMPW